MLIPFFRRVKTGKFDFYIGDRFAADGSEPRFGGVVIFLTLLIGLLAGRTAEGINGSYILCGVFFCFLLLCVGLYEDYVREKKCGIGMKPLYKILCEYVGSVGFLVLLKFFGFEADEILLPFRWGYISTGVLYIPLTALLMTAVIHMCEIYDCPNGVTEKGCGGLSQITAVIISLSMAEACSLAFSEGCGEAELFAVCTAGACGGLLFWSCSPSKMYTGQSGSILTGGLLCCTAVFSKLHFGFLLCTLAIVINMLCRLLQRAVYRKSRKLLFKGETLCEHLKNIGWDDYRIMTVAGLVTIVGGVTAAVFGAYAGRL
jgi:phospho-N-acetylmuramoyl-pentapeptide-transferase